MNWIQRLWNMISGSKQDSPKSKPLSTEEVAQWMKETSPENYVSSNTWPAKTPEEELLERLQEQSMKALEELKAKMETHQTGTKSRFNADGSPSISRDEYKDTLEYVKASNRLSNIEKELEQRRTTVFERQAHTHESQKASIRTSDVSDASIDAAKLRGIALHHTSESSLIKPSYGGADVGVTTHIPGEQMIDAHGRKMVKVSGQWLTVEEAIAYAGSSKHEPKKEYVTQQQYLTKLTHIPIIHKAEVIYADYPNEVAIRIEMVKNTRNTNQSIVETSQEKLFDIMENVRISGCKEIDLSIAYREVIK